MDWPRSWVETVEREGAHLLRAQPNMQIKAGETIFVKWGDLKGRCFRARFMQGTLVCISVPRTIQGRVVNVDVSTGAGEVFLN